MDRRDESGWAHATPRATILPGLRGGCCAGGSVFKFSLSLSLFSSALPQGSWADSDGGCFCARTIQVRCRGTDDLSASEHASVSPLSLRGRDQLLLPCGCCCSSRQLERPVEWTRYCRDCRPDRGDSFSLRFLSSRSRPRRFRSSVCPLRRPPPSFRPLFSPASLRLPSSHRI
jgi:hypothetical protein